MTRSSDQPRGFATTHWSFVLAAGIRTSPESEQALAELCGRYWYPIYAYLRRRVGDEHEAKDSTQAFFAHLLEKNALAAAQPERGRFRTFLLTCCNHFLQNEWEKARAQKRGGGKALLPLDFASGDSRYNLEPAHTWTPERLFHRQWALTLLEQVMAKLRAEHVNAGKSEFFDLMKAFLTGTSTESHATVAAQLDMTQGAVKVAAHRLRQRYRDLLKQEVADTLADGEDVDDEIRQLFECLG